MSSNPGRALQREPLSTELVICTRNRPSEVKSCLASIAHQSRLPDSIRVVDSSDSSSTEELVARVDQQGELDGRLLYQRAPVGLTVQRNAAIRSTTADIILFVDDDTVLEEKYVEAVCQEFELDEAVLGVGGVITNIRRHPPVMRLVKRAFLLDSNSPARVLPSGRISVAVDLTSKVDADWLAGGAMAFRRKVFDSLSFNEALPGPSRGEDIEFSYRVKQQGRLVITPKARLAHYPSPENRISVAQHTYDELVERARRVRTGLGNLRMRWYWWSVFGQVLALAVLAPLSIDARVRLKSSLAGAVAVIRESRSCSGESSAPTAQRSMLDAEQTN